MTTAPATAKVKAPDITSAPSPTPSPLDLLTTAVSPHGYAVTRGNSGGSLGGAVTTPHAPKIITETHPSQDNTHLLNEVLALFSQARAHRRPMVSLWKRCQRMLYNRYFPTSRPGWLPTPEVPEIFPICAAVVGWMTDQRIGYTVAPTAVPHSGYFDFFQTLATDLEAVMDATWQVNCEENEWTKMMWDAVTYGTGIGKTTWDLTLCGGQGDAVTRQVLLESFYPDPQARTMEDANYFIEARIMSVQELDRRWPGTAALFPDGGNMSQDVDTLPTQVDQAGNANPPRANPGAISPSTSPRYGQPGGARHHATDLPGVLVLEAWIREHDTLDNTRDIKTGEKMPTVHDRWRVIVVAGNHVIMNEPADNLWSHGKHPYSRLVLWDTGELWGRSLVDLLMPNQVSINRILAALQSNVELTGDPIWKDAVGAAGGRRTMTNKPGQRIPVNAGDTSTGWLSPPPIPPTMMQLLQFHLQRMEAISGLSAITKGGTPGGRPAQSVVDALQEAAFVRIRQHLRNLEYTMRDAGNKRASLIVENYTQPRMVAIAGPSGERSSLALKARHWMIPTNQGAVPMQYQLSIDAGSRMHTSRAMREDRAIQMYTLGLIDREATLGDLTYPNATVVAQRMDEHERQMAAMGAQAGPGARQRAQH